MTAAHLFQIGSGWFPDKKGGAENAFFNLFGGLGGEGFSVRGVVPSEADPVSQTQGRMQGFAVQGAPLLRRAMNIRRLAQRSFSTERPDVIASHFALYSLPLLDRITKLPLVVHFHGPWALESAIEGGGSAAVRVKKAVETTVYRRAQRIIVLSVAFGNLLQEYYGVPDSVLRLVPGGVDCPRFDVPQSREDARAILGWDIDRPTIVTARRLVRRMGLDRLIDAIGLVRAAPGGRDIVVHIVGTGPERAALEAKAAAQGLSHAIHFDGFVPDEHLPLAYRAADLTVVPTADLEGFGLVAAESLAAGTPVLATPVGGLPEVVRGLCEDMVLRGCDAHSIADGISAFLASPAFLPDAAACSGYARQNFDWSVIIPRIASVYREVLS